MPSSATTVLLVRNAQTEWNRLGRVLGSRDLGLSADGLNQAHAAAMAMRHLQVAEVIASPLLRTIQTAEVIAGLFDVEVARDPRLTEVRMARWEGLSYAEVEAVEEYRRFLTEPLRDEIPGAEHLGDVRDRMLASLEQALADNPGGACVVVVSHATPLRVLLAHYLGMGLASYHRLRLNPGSISVLRFTDDRELPRVLAVNHDRDLGVILR